MAGVWLTFILLNILTIHDPSRDLFYVRVCRLGINIPAFAATLIVRPGRRIGPFGFAVIAVMIVQNVLLQPFLSPVSLPCIQPTEIAMLVGVGAFCACVTFSEGVLLAAGTFCASVFTVAFLLHESALLVVFHSAWVLSLLVAAGSSGYLLDRTQRVVWLREIDLRRAEERIRELLHNVLSPSIAARKLAGEAPIADQFADAGLLFADVVGFTTLSTRLDSTQVGMLSDLFSRFDTISARYGLEKSRRLATATRWPPEFPSRFLTIWISWRRRPLRCWRK
jgi:hypothetical protein